MLHNSQAIRALCQRAHVYQVTPLCLQYVRAVSDDLHTLGDVRNQTLSLTCVRVLDPVCNLHGKSAAIKPGIVCKSETTNCGVTHPKSLGTGSSSTLSRSSVIHDQSSPLGTRSPLSRSSDSHRLGRHYSLNIRDPGSSVGSVCGIHTHRGPLWTNFLDARDPDQEEKDHELTLRQDHMFEDAAKALKVIIVKP